MIFLFLLSRRIEIWGMGISRRAAKAEEENSLKKEEEAKCVPHNRIKLKIKLSFFSSMK